MIYYRKTLFGCGPKLTAVHEDNWKANTPRWIKQGEEGFKEYLDEYKGNNEKACIATATQYRTYKYLKWEEIKLLFGLNKK